jgi:hypothetical protein
MGYREYARHRETHGLPGITLRAVQKAIESGRITTILDEKGRAKIDPEVADIQWDSNTDPDQSARANAGRETAAPKSGDQASGGKREEGNRYWDAKTEREIVELNRARLALAKDSGQLVDKDEVRRAGYDSGRQLRDMILSIPSRMASELAAQGDARAIEARMSEELRKVLDALSQLAQAGFSKASD